MEIIIDKSLTVTPSQFVEIREFISDNLTVRKQVLPTFKLAELLFHFEEKFDLSSMYRFIVWGKSNDLDDDEILATIIHDLNGMNDECFSPRTSNY